MSDVSDINEMRRKRIIERKRAIKERSARMRKKCLYGEEISELNDYINQILIISPTEGKDE